MTQEDLGLQTGVHRNYIGGIERGERSPTVATVAVLADALGVSLGELLTQAEVAQRNQHRGVHQLGPAAPRSPGWNS